MLNINDLFADIGEKSGLTRRLRRDVAFLQIKAKIWQARS
jgi:hypothetical protein